MQIVSNGYNLHEMSISVFSERQEKYFKLLSAENFTQSDKGVYLYKPIYFRLLLAAVLTGTLRV